MSPLVTDSIEIEISHFCYLDFERSFYCTSGGFGCSFLRSFPEL